MANKGSQRQLGATDAGLKPGDYPLGSAQSRAAARANLERRFAGRKRLDVVTRCIVDVPGFAEPQLGKWRECPDGSLLRFSRLPAGMTIEEAERIVAQPGWKPTASPAKPECPRPPLKPEW